MHMISYSTNWMGPISMDWFRDRGLTREVDTEVTHEYLAIQLGVNVGDVVPMEDVTEYWSGGRVDIYGLDEVEYYGGMSEYSLPIMDGVSWNLFSDWLDNYETIELKTYEQLLSAFEADTDHKIRWAHKEFDK